MPLLGHASVGPRGFHLFERGPRHLELTKPTHRGADVFQLQPRDDLGEGLLIHRLGSFEAVGHIRHEVLEKDETIVNHLGELFADREGQGHPPLVVDLAERQ